MNSEVETGDGPGSEDGDTGFTARFVSLTNRLDLDTLATKSGIPRKSLQNYRRGVTRHPPIDKVDRLAQALGVSLEWLATGRGPQRRGDAESPSSPVDLDLLRSILVRTGHELRAQKLRPTPEEFADFVLLRYRMEIRRGQME